MKKKNLLLTYILIIAVLMCGCQTTSSATYTSEGFYLDTYVSITIWGGNDKIADKAIEMCAQYENIFDCTDSDSLVSELNRQQTMTMESNDEAELLDVIKSAAGYAGLTEGALDITVEPLTALWDFDNNRKVPDEDSINEAVRKVDYHKITIDGNKISLNGTCVDLGAVAKGYIADRIAEYLKDNNVSGAIINLGGNIYCLGNKPGNENFTVGIQYPFGEADNVIATLSLTDKSVVTSGVYERYFYDNDNFYHHILDPSTGYPCDNGLLSVTIIADDSLVCDCLSTGCFVMGKDRAMELIDSMDGVYGIFVDEDYNVTYSKGAKAFVK